MRQKCLALILGRKSVDFMLGQNEVNYGIMQKAITATPNPFSFYLSTRIYVCAVEEMPNKYLGATVNDINILQNRIQLFTDL